MDRNQWQEYLVDGFNMDPAVVDNCMQAANLIANKFNISADELQPAGTFSGGCLNINLGTEEHSYGDIFVNTSVPVEEAVTWVPDKQMIERMEKEQQALGSKEDKEKPKESEKVQKHQKKSDPSKEKKNKTPKNKDAKKENEQVKQPEKVNNTEKLNNLKAQAELQQNIVKMRVKEIEDIKTEYINAKINLLKEADLAEKQGAPDSLEKYVTALQIRTDEYERRLNESKANLEDMKKSLSNTKNEILKTRIVIGKEAINNGYKTCIDIVNNAKSTIQKANKEFQTVKSNAYLSITERVAQKERDSWSKELGNLNQSYRKTEKQLNIFIDRCETKAKILHPFKAKKLERQGKNLNSLFSQKDREAIKDIRADLRDFDNRMHIVKENYKESLAKSIENVKGSKELSEKSFEKGSKNIRVFADKQVGKDLDKLMANAEKKSKEFEEMSKVSDQREANKTAKKDRNERQ